MHYSYDYSDLLDELKNDIEEGLITLQSDIKVVRNDTSTFNNYYPVIDYYYFDNETEEEYEVVKVEKVIEEMEYYNKIIK